LSDRTCTFVKPTGERCRSAPLQESDFCFWHSPEHAEEAAEARRLGGLRRRREKITSGAYGFEGLGSAEDIRRLLEVAVVDTLALDNSIARARTLAYLAQVSVKLLETGEVEERVAALEQTLGPRLEKGGRRR